MDNEFWAKAGRKLVQNLLSVKVWIMFSFLGVSTLLLFKGSIDGTVWASVNGGIITTVCTMREAFKVSKVKSEDDTKDLMV